MKSFLALLTNCSRSFSGGQDGGNFTHSSLSIFDISGCKYIRTSLLTMDCSTFSWRTIPVVSPMKILWMYVSGQLVTSRCRDGTSVQQATIVLNNLATAFPELSHSSSASTTSKTGLGDVMLQRGLRISCLSWVAEDLFTISGSSWMTCMMPNLTSGYD